MSKIQPIPAQGGDCCIRVYYEDTDAGGVVYYANYLKFAERARTELLRKLGFEQEKLWKTQDVGFAVRGVRAEFIAPARLDDLLGVQTRVREMKRVSLMMEQKILRGKELLVTLEVRLAVINSKFKPVALPAKLRVALEKTL